MDPRADPVSRGLTTKKYCIVTEERNGKKKSIHYWHIDNIRYVHRTYKMKSRGKIKIRKKIGNWITPLFWHLDFCEIFWNKFSVIFCFIVTSFHVSFFFLVFPWWVGLLVESHYDGSNDDENLSGSFFFFAAQFTQFYRFGAARFICFTWHQLRW